MQNRYQRSHGSTYNRGSYYLSLQKKRYKRFWPQGTSSIGVQSNAFGIRCHERRSGASEEALKCVLKVDKQISNQRQVKMCFKRWYHNPRGAYFKFHGRYGHGERALSFQKRTKHRTTLATRKL